MNDALHIVNFTSLEPGPRLLVTGAVHGNEKCGTYAIRRILKEFEEGALHIERGSVTFVPICNPAAFEQDARFVERNLNRFLIPQANPGCYESRIGNILCAQLEKCEVLLDLHSYKAGGPPFVFVGNPYTKEHDFANILGAKAGVTGWQQAYANSGRAQQATDPDEPIGTTEYARRFGAIGVTLECGQHKDPVTHEIAYRAVKNALGFLGLVPTLAPADDGKNTPLIEVKKVFYRGQGGSFVKDWKHLDQVKAGEMIATDDRGKPVTVAGDGYLILPDANTDPDTEWFYWGQEAVRPPVAKPAARLVRSPS